MRLTTPTPGSRAGIGELLTIPGYPGCLERLFPSITEASAHPCAVIADSGNGLAGMGIVEDSGVADTVGKLDRLTPDDTLYDNASGGYMGYVATLARYWGADYASDPRVMEAVERARKRYDFAKSNFPGVQILPAGSYYPSGSGYNPPIAIWDPTEGTIGYAPGYGPIAQYGGIPMNMGDGKTVMVQQPGAAPPIPKVNVYTGATAPGMVNILPAQVPSTSSTAAPINNYYYSNPEPGSAPTGDSGSVNVGGVSIPTPVLIGGAALMMAMVVMGGRR